MKEIRMLKHVCIEPKQKHINLLNREIHYKPLRWIRYPLQNKKDLIIRKGSIFSKFDMKSGYYQIQIAEEDKYKTAFTFFWSL